jgi:hypothetical protein
MTGIFWLARRIAPWLMERGVRPVGKVVGPTVILGIARPFVAVASALELAHDGPTFATFDRLPEGLRPPRGLAGRLGLWRERTRLNLAKLVSYWSDVLATPRWSRLCRFEGAGSSLEAVLAGSRPVILATLHFGPLEMLYYSLRSRRVPIAILVADGEGRRPPHRVRLLRNCDRGAEIEGLPHLFPTTELREAAEFLLANRVLIVVTTGGSGSGVVSGDDRAGLHLSPGAFRLASLVDALVIPCTITAGRSGSVTIELAEVLPPEILGDRRQHAAACERLCRFFLPAVRSSTGQADPWLLQCLRPVNLGPGER